MKEFCEELYGRRGFKAFWKKVFCNHSSYNWEDLPVKGDDVYMRCKRCSKIQKKFKPDYDRWKN